MVRPRTLALPEMPPECLRRILSQSSMKPTNPQVMKSPMRTIPVAVKPVGRLKVTPSTSSGSAIRTRWPAT